MDDVGTGSRRLRRHGSFHRQALPRLLRPPCSPVLTAQAMTKAKNGSKGYAAGLVVARQRPETALGILFLLLEDETGMVNVVIRPDLYERKKAVIRGKACSW